MADRGMTCWLAALAVGLAACESVDAPSSIMKPPPRVGAPAETPAPEAASEAAPPPAPPPKPAAPGPQAPSLPEPFARMTLADPLLTTPLGELSVLTTLPYLEPPRALVKDGSGREHVVALGARLGDAGGIVTAVTPSAIVVTAVELSPITGVAGMTERRMSAALPAPTGAVDAPPRAPGGGLRGQ